MTNTWPHHQECQCGRWCPRCESWDLKDLPQTNLEKFETFRNSTFASKPEGQHRMVFWVTPPPLPMRLVYLIITTCMGKDRISNSAKRMACALCKYLPGLTKGGQQKTGEFWVVEGIGTCFFLKDISKTEHQKTCFSRLKSVSLMCDHQICDL